MSFFHIAVKILLLKQSSLSRKYATQHSELSPLQYLSIIQYKESVEPFSFISKEVLTKPGYRRTETIPTPVSLSDELTLTNTDKGAVVHILVSIEIVRFLLKDSAKTLSSLCMFWASAPKRYKGKNIFGFDCTFCGDCLGNGLGRRSR